MRKGQIMSGGGGEKGEKGEIVEEKKKKILLYVQVRGNLRQPQWAIKQMGNLVMPIKSGGREGKNREMKQNVILIRTTWLPSPSSSPMGQHCCHIDSLQSLSSS